MSLRLENILTAQFRIFVKEVMIEHAYLTKQ
jgi:hypothetical protein